jgi:hypothetical protein
MAEWLAGRFVPGFSDEHRVPVGHPSFRAYGHTAARLLGGKFVDEPLPGMCRNHTSALVTLRDATTRVLLHDELSLLAFAAYDPDESGYGGYRFVDAPPLASAFGATFVPVPKSVLDGPCDLLALEQAVGKDPDIQYWTPRRLGDILYNFWD